MFVKYAVNKSQSEVQMIDNRICIPVGGWQGITEDELKHPDILYAFRKDWISLEDNQPKSPAKPERKRVKTVNASDPSFSGEKTPAAKVSKIGS